MSTLSPIFEKQYSTEVASVYQQGASTLRNLVRNVTVNGASTYDFFRLDDLSSNSSQTGDGEVTLLDPTLDAKTATLTDYHSNILVKNLDEIKTKADVRKQYVFAQASKLGRDTDDVIITAALTASGLQTIPTIAGGLTVAKIKEAKYALDVVDVPNDERYFALDAASLQSLLSDSEVAQVVSGDYNTVKALVNGEIDTFMGFKFVRTSRISSTGSPTYIHSCFAFHKEAVGLAVGQDVKTRIDYVPMRKGDLIASDMSIGAVRIWNEGVVKVPVDIAI